MGVPGTNLSGWRWLRGRASRREYWLWLVSLLIVNFAISQGPGYIAQLVAGIAFLLIPIRRLHDFGRTGWWVAALGVGQIAAFGAASAFAEDEAAMQISNGLLLAAYVVVGLIPGDRHENRFGPPTRALGVKDVFS